MPHSVQDVCRTSARIRFKFTYFESAFEILRSDNRRFASCTRSLLSVWPDVGVKKVVHMSPKVAQIVETTVLTYNDPFLRSLKCHHSFWATFVSKFVRLNFQNMPNLVTLSLFHPHLSLSVSLPLTHLYTSLFRVGSISLSLSLSQNSRSLKNSDFSWVCSFGKERHFQEAIIETIILFRFRFWSNLCWSFFSWVSASSI